MEVADFLNALLPLFIVFGVLWGILYYVKKYTNTSKSKVSKSVNVQVISNQMILPKKYISIVKVKDSLLVLGVSEGSINLLKELEYDSSLDDELRSEEVNSNFLDILKKKFAIKMKRALLIITLLMLIAGFASDVAAQQNQTIPLPKIGLDIGTSDSPEDVSATIQILLLMTVLSLAPSILIMTTSYLRLIIVFHFLKQALGTQQMPPSQLMAGIGLFITFFIMAPTWTQVNDTALQPLMKGEMNISQAYEVGVEPIREFMFAHVRDEDLELFISLSQDTRPETRLELPTYILLPAFALSELRAGFLIGFFLFIPFLMVDMIVGSILLSMGMMMIPPMMVALPFKILLFVLVDGWNLIIGSVMRSFT